MSPKMNQITAVTILIKDPNTGFYLGVSRKDDPNAFGLPGGKVDPGETPVEAAVRELHEETGLVGDPNTAHEVFRRPCEGGKDGIEFFVATFVMKTSGEIATTETGRVSWVTKQTLFDGPFGKYNKAMFDDVIICQHCRGTGKEYITESVCRICKGYLAIVRPRALLLDDYRTPEQVTPYPDHYKLVVCRNNTAAIEVVDSQPTFDVWFLDRDLSLDTTYTFLHYVADLNKWPNRIEVVSESGHARRLAEDVKAMCPTATVTLHGEPIERGSNWVAEANAVKTLVAPVADMTFHIYRNTAVNVEAMTRPTTVNKPWYDADKKSKGTMHIKRKKNK